MSKTVDIREMKRIPLPTTDDKIRLAVRDATHDLAQSTIVPLKKQYGDEAVTTKSGFEHTIFINHNGLYVEVSGVLIVPDELEVQYPGVPA